jgi:hypothetical protein
MDDIAEDVAALTFGSLKRTILHACSAGSMAQSGAGCVGSENHSAMQFVETFKPIYTPKSLYLHKKVT